MNKLKFLSWFALTVFSATAWAAVTQGPWTYMDYRTGCCDRTTNMAMSFNNLNNSHWATVSGPWVDEDGIGFTVKEGKANQNSKNGVYSTYYRDENVPAYTRKRLTWAFQVGSRSTKHYSNTCLYAKQCGWQDINALTVDFTEEYSDKTGSGNLIAQYRNTSLSGACAYTSVITKTFDFDNRNGSSAATKSWCLLLTHVVSSADPVNDIWEWGAFRHSDAQWATYYYRYVTFNANGGSGSMSTQTVENSATLTNNAFSRTGYTFDGWATSSTGSKAFDNKATITATESAKGPVTLYARWKANSYTCTLDRQNGTGGSASVTVTYAAALPAITVPTRAGYTFGGYYSEVNGEGTQYIKADGTSAKNWDKAGSMTLYAKWTPITYTLTYDLNGGTTDTINRATYTVETPTFTLARPKRIGYTFAGWTGSNGATPQTAVTIAKGSTGDKTYTANWAIDPNTPVHYVDSLGEPVADEVVAFNRPEAPEVEGFTFVRWEVQPGALKDGFKLQAVYTENEPSGAPAKKVGMFTLVRKDETNEYILK